jgi:hypothetical protein
MEAATPSAWDDADWSALKDKFGNYINTSTVPSSFDEADWNQLVDFIDSKGLDELVGSKKTITLAGYGDFDFVLVGKNNLGYIFQSDKILTTHYMNSSNSSSGGWGSSLMRTWLNDTLLSAFPVNIINLIKETTVKYSESTGSTTSTCSDKLWLPSYQEVFGEGSNSNIEGGVEGTQFAYYSNGGSKIKYNTSGSAYGWWLRSVYGSAGFWGVTTGGSAFYGGASITYGVAPCFCI